jgi:RNA polymerase sigma factor (sigma-70 family)
MDDRDFVKRCAAGEKKAQDEFLARFSRLIYGYIHATLKSKGFRGDPETADELFQEVIVLLFKDDSEKLRAFKGINNCSLASWLRVVTVNFTLNYIRKKHPISLEEESEDGLMLKDIIPADAPLASASLARKEQLISLQDCIQVLTADEKYFIELHFNKGLDLESLTGHFSVSRSALDMRKSRIMERLRDCFKKKGFFG